jgi:transposase
MRTHGSAEQLERRRREAVALLDQGLSVAVVARRVRAAERSVRHWRQTAREQGEAALAAVPHPGKPPKLSARQRDGLRKRLLKGARSEGFDTELWTCPRVKEVIRRRYGVDYHVEALPYVLKSLGFTCQKPQLQAVERDDAAIAAWVAKDWPRIKKSRPTTGQARLRR